jgi:hypothetical protein
MSKNLNAIAIVTQIHSECAIFLRPGRPHNTLLIWELGWPLEVNLQLYQPAQIPIIGGDAPSKIISM